MKILLIIFLILAVILAILLFAPIRIKLTFYRDAVKNEVKLVLSYLKFRIVLFDSTDKKEKKPKKDKPKKEKEPFSYEREKARLEKYINIFVKSWYNI